MSGNPAHVRGPPDRRTSRERRRNSEKRGSTESVEHAGVPVSRRILTNVRVLVAAIARAPARPSTPPNLRVLFFANSTERRRRSISLSVLCLQHHPAISLSLSQILIYGQVINWQKVPLLPASSQNRTRSLSPRPIGRGNYLRFSAASSTTRFNTPGHVIHSRVVHGIVIQTASDFVFSSFPLITDGHEASYLIAATSRFLIYEVSTFLLALDWTWLEVLQIRTCIIIYWFPKFFLWKLKLVVVLKKLLF